MYAYKGHVFLHFLTVYQCKNMRIPDKSIFHKHMYIFLMLHAKKVYKHARSPRSIILLHEKHKQDVVCLDYLCIFPKICMFFICMYTTISMRPALTCFMDLLICIVTTVDSRCNLDYAIGPLCIGTFAHTIHI